MIYGGVDVKDVLSKFIIWCFDFLGYGIGDVDECLRYGGYVKC